MQAEFADIYEKLKMPVAVCATDEHLTAVYLNAAAKLVFAPTMAVEQMQGNVDDEPLEHVLRFRNRDDFKLFRLALGDSGSVSDFDAAVLSFQGDIMHFRLFANAATIGGRDYFVVYLGDPVRDAADGGNSRFMTRILGASHYIHDASQSVNAILRLAGEHIRASRMFVFEDISPAITRNTYEWCAPGVKSCKEAWRNLRKDRYNHDAIMGRDGMIITSDVRLLPENDRLILESQGIKSVAILPLRHYDTDLGYIGFDDCAENREWSMAEIQLLKSVATVVGSLINRRNIERQSRRGRDIFRAVADNLNELVYISDLDTGELKFVSKSLAKVLGKTAAELVGLPCWSVLHRDQDGPCPFCQLPRIRGDGPGGEGVVWELHSSASGKWYMVKDSVIDWVDGDVAHLGTLVDITYRKQYEEQLKRFAATDAMTDVFNRKWGYGKLEELFRNPHETRKERTLCFIDIDNLKSVNDRLGHAAGDELIVNAIRTVFACIRKNDFITRWGGDEFIVFLNCSLDDSLGVLAKINFGIDHFNSTSGKPYILSVSAGLVGFGETFSSIDALIEEADRRMYANKHKKRESGNQALP